MKTNLKQPTPTAVQSLVSYSWAGNARQLENEIKRLIVSVRGKSIAEDCLDLPFEIQALLFKNL